MIANARNVFGVVALLGLAAPAQARFLQAIRLAIRISTISMLMCAMIL